MSKLRVECLSSFFLTEASNFYSRSYRYLWKLLNCNLLNLWLARLIRTLCFEMKYSWALVTLRGEREVLAVIPKFISLNKSLYLKFLSLIIIFLSVVPRDEALSVWIWFIRGTIEPSFFYKCGLLLLALFFILLFGIVDLN